MYNYIRKSLINNHLDTYYFRKNADSNSKKSQHRIL